MEKFVRSVGKDRQILHVTKDLVNKLKTKHLLGVKNTTITAPARNVNLVLAVWGTNANIRGDYQLGSFKFNALYTGKSVWEISMWTV